MWGSGFGHRPRGPSASASLAPSEKGDALMTVEHGSPLIEEYHRRAAEARRLADTHGVSLDERDDLLEVERRWLSLAEARCLLNSWLDF
jgi:hypothetical protein